MAETPHGAALAALQNEAKDLQAQLGFVQLQLEHWQAEKTRLMAQLKSGERAYGAIAGLPATEPPVQEVANG